MVKCKALILGMEKDMLTTLGFHLTVPTAYHFMSRFCEAAGADADKQFQHLVGQCMFTRGSPCLPSTLEARI